MRAKECSTQRVLRLAVLVSGVALLSCSKGSCSGPIGAGAAMIGPAGGTLEIPLPEGAVVIEVPPGALQKDLRLTGVRRSGFVPGAASVAVDLGPEGTTFAKPVVIKFRPSSVRSPRLPAMLLRGATLVDGAWQFLPTRVSKAGLTEIDTMHFSSFALVAPCMTAGTGDDFPLVGCPAFNPRIQTSVPLTLDATAASISLRILVEASAGSAPATFSISGLTPATTYYLQRDGNPRVTDVLTSDSGGKLTFVQDVAAPHLLMLSSRHGSVALSSATCIPPLGVFSAATNTCALTEDIPDGDVSIAVTGMTLDCLDPVTHLRHTIGASATHVAAGVVVFDTANVRVKNCNITNADFGVQVVRAGGFEGRSLNLSGGNSGSNGVGARGVDAADSVAVRLFDLDVVDFAYGVIGVGNGNLEVHHAHLATGFNLLFFDDPLLATTQPIYTPSLALIAVSGDLATFSDCTVDGSASGSAPATAAAPVAIVNVAASNLVRLAVDHVSAYGAGAWIVSGSNTVARVTDSSVRNAQVGLRIDGDTSEVAGNTLTNNEVGLQLTGTLHSVFHNNIRGNSMRQVDSLDPLELSDTRPASPTFGQGGYWGRSCPGALFLAGTDSNRANVIDSHPFQSPDAWSVGSFPGCPTLATPVLISPVQNALLATGSVPFLGTAVVGATVELMEGQLPRGSAQVGPIGAFYLVPVAPFSEGFHWVTVRARLNGSTSSVSTRLGFTVESTAPPTPTVTFPTAGLVLNGNSVIIAGAAEAGALVQIQEGITVIGACVSDPGGAFRVTVDLPSGVHTVTAIAQDRAGNPSLPSAAVTFTLAPATTRTPLVGVEGRIRISSMTETGTSFVPTQGESNTLRIEGSVSLPGNGGASTSYGAGSGGNGIGYGRPSFRVDLWRQVLDPSTGREVATYAATAAVTTPTGGANVGLFAISTTWPGVDLTRGGYASPGAYLGKITLRVVRDPYGPIPPVPGPIPIGDCDPGRGPRNCTLDVLEMLDSMSILNLHLPDFGPTFPCGPPVLAPDGGTPVAEKVVGVRIVVKPKVTLGRFQVDSAEFQAGQVEHLNPIDGTRIMTTGLKSEQIRIGPDGGRAAVSTTWVDRDDKVVTVELNDNCIPHDAGAPHDPVPCWKGNFQLPVPGTVLLTAGVSGTTAPRVRLSDVFTSPMSQGAPRVKLLGDRLGAVHGSLDRSGVRFFTRVPEIYRRIGLTTETQDFRPMFVALPETATRPPTFVESPAFLDWHPPASPFNPLKHPELSQFRWLLKDPDQEKKFSYFADWQTDQVSAQWFGDEPFSGCPDPKQLFATPRSLKFGGAGLAIKEPKEADERALPFPATAIFKTGVFVEPDAGVSLRVSRAALVEGDFSAVVDAGSPGCGPCAGCCLGQTCVSPSFTNNNTCGSNGRICARCPGSQLCSAGVCL